MKVYVVTCIVDEESCAYEIEGVYAREEDARQYVEENQETFEHWCGKTFNTYDYKEMEVL